MDAQTAETLRQAATAENYTTVKAILASVLTSGFVGVIVGKILTYIHDKKLKSLQLQLDKSLSDHALEIDKRLNSHDLKIKRYLPLIRHAALMPTKGLTHDCAALLNEALYFVSDDTLGEILEFNEFLTRMQGESKARGELGFSITGALFKPLVTSIRKDLDLESKSLAVHDLRFFTGSDKKSDDELDEVEGLKNVDFDEED